MYKKWVYCARSVFALSCIFCMLFLNTLSVRAELSQNNQFGYYGTEILNINPYTYFDRSVIIEPTYQSTDISGGTYSGSSELSNAYGSGAYRLGWVNGGPNTVDPSILINGVMLDRLGNQTESGTISFTTTHGGSTIAHFKIPIFVGGTQANNVKLDTNKYYYVYLDLSQPTVSKGTVTNVCLKDDKDTIITSLFNTDINDKVIFKLGSELLTYRSYVYGFYCYYCFDYMLGNSGSFDSFNLTQTGSLQIREVASNYQSSISNGSSDAQTHQKLDELNDTQESIKDTTEDTNETTHSIFDSISAFFGSFFNNLIGVFVPEDGFFTTWFNNLNTLLTQKLGILYYPFSVFIDVCNRLVTAVAGNQPSDAVFYFPELKINISGQNYTILAQQEVHLANYAVNIQNADTSNSPMFGLNNLIHVIRRFTDIILTLLMFKLLRQKLNLIIKGEDYDN